MVQNFFTLLYQRWIRFLPFEFHRLAYEQVFYGLLFRTYLPLLWARKLLETLIIVSICLRYVLNRLKLYWPKIIQWSSSRGISYVWGYTYFRPHFLGEGEAVLPLFYEGVTRPVGTKSGVIELPQTHLSVKIFLTASLRFTEIFLGSLIIYSKNL